MSSPSSRARSSGPVHRSVSPSGRFWSSTTSKSPFKSSSSAFASSTSSSFSSRSHTFFSHQTHHDNYYQQNSHHRSASSTGINPYTAEPLSSSVKFSIDHRSVSPNRSISNHVITKNAHPISTKKKTCTCSPTTHPGSFRCNLHKNMQNHHAIHNADAYTSNRLNMRRSAMKNSLVRIGSVEGEWVKRALTTLIRPSSHQLRRRGAFEPRPSRLSIMSKAEVL